MLDHPKAEFQLLLALAFKSVNDSSGPEGLVPSSSLFGVFPRPTIPSDSGWRPKTDEIIRMAGTARHEMKIQLDKMISTHSLKQNIPEATDSI